MEGATRELLVARGFSQHLQHGREERAMSKVAVIAVGGNALASEGGGTSIPDQALAAARTAQYVVDIAAAEVPVDYATADTQGAIGVMFQRAFINELNRRGLKKPVATVVTQVRVDPADKAFANPTKPIGSIMTKDVADALAKRNGWSLMEEPGRGWRRCVASPQPQEVIEVETVRALLGSGHIVIACGGGGIPVVRPGNSSSPRRCPGWPSISASRTSNGSPACLSPRPRAIWTRGTLARVRWGRR